jgi:cell division inhibitor SepF
MHRMGVYLGLVEDDEYADADGYAAAGHPAERSSERGVERAARTEDYNDRRYPREKHPAEVYGGRDTGARDTGARDPGARDPGGRDWDDAAVHYAEEYSAQPAYQITALHPRTYNEARQIGEHFRKSTPVIMNLSDMDDADAKRLVDFAAGLTFGLHGRIERVTAKVFLLSPHNVSVTAQDKAKIENGFFNQS